MNLSKKFVRNFIILTVLALSSAAASLRADQVTVTISPSDVLTAQFDATFLPVESVYSIMVAEGATNVPLSLMNQYEISTMGFVNPSSAQAPYPQAFFPTVLPGAFDSIGSFYSFTEQPIGYNLFVETDNNSLPSWVTLSAAGTAVDIGLVNLTKDQTVDVVVNDERVRVVGVPDEFPTFNAVIFGLGAIVGMSEFRRRRVPALVRVD
jgi:hypothetical protein